MMSAKVIFCIFLLTLFDYLNVSIEENCVDQDQTASLMVLLIDIFKKVDFEKNQQTIKKHAKLPSMQ